MFIEAVKAHRDGVPDKLAREIRAFTQQEVIHSREHVVFNRKAGEAGYDLSELEADVDTVMEMIRQRSEEHTSELQSLMRISYAVFCLTKKKHITTPSSNTTSHTH